MIWWRHKEWGRWSRQWHSYRGWSFSDLRRARGLVGVELASYPEAARVREGIALGFAPRTYCSSVASNNGIELPKGLDGILITYAMYQRIQVTERRYPEPGDLLWLLPNVFTENQKYRQVRLK